MNDAVGQELRIGDKVAYVGRRGSVVTIEERTVTNIGTHEEYNGAIDQRVYLDNSRSAAKPYNMVVLHE